MMRFGFVLAAIAVLFSAAPVVAYGAEPVGVWLTEKGDARVKITKCSSGICGVVVWLREPIDRATGRPQVDDKNPNPALRTRPVSAFHFSSACARRHPASGPARSTMPTTAAPMSAMSPSQAATRCRSRAAWASSAAARPGPASRAEAFRCRPGGRHVLVPHRWRMAYSPDNDLRLFGKVGQRCVICSS